jgi:cytochrome c oxidase cbb3-type subunit 3
MAEDDKHSRKPAAPKTMGHEWDGIAEYNNPLPRWWVLVFMACIAWAVGYMVVMPSVPGVKDFFGGTAGFSSRADVRASVAGAATERQEWLKPMADASLDEIVSTPALRQMAMRGGEVIFKENCAACHMVGGAGTKGYPALVDDEWIWGGSLAEIQQTVQHGIRSGDPMARTAEMPAFGRDGLLSRAEIGDVADFVLAMAAGKPGLAAGKALYEANCAVCHGDRGEGMTETGAPALNNRIWLYGGSRAEVMAQVSNPRHGVMPNWAGRLSDVEIKQVTVYVHSLGGGQ